MGRHQRTDVSQGNTMEQYTTVVPTPQRDTRLAGSEDGQSGLLPAEELSQAEILAAIQGSRVALEGNIETVAVKMNLLRADLRKVSDKVKVAKGSIVELQAEVETLRGTGQATGTSGVVNRASGADGSDWRNREGERTVSMDQGVVDVPPPRIEIQQDRTMAVVPDGLVAGTGAGTDLDSLSTSVQS
ncbi:hypothetical protein NDU88_003316 [Pleurodeles waltl]|uniref:Uncharacterized protein n=1 Tax=Pleurodeles waltl TaxID=8319 RepID=A0AAV7MY60_PLEWA|nr:hypothetical protein NDU88_003316 [Pleurodeles waltl]